MQQGCTLANDAKCTARSTFQVEQFQRVTSLHHGPPIQNCLQIKPSQSKPSCIINWEGQYKQGIGYRALSLPSIQKSKTSGTLVHRGVQFTITTGAKKHRNCMFMTCPLCKVRTKGNGFSTVLYAIAHSNSTIRTREESNTIRQTSRGRLCSSPHMAFLATIQNTLTI